MPESEIIHQAHHIHTQKCFVVNLHQKVRIISVLISVALYFCVYYVLLAIQSCVVVYKKKNLFGKSVKENATEF